MSTETPDEISDNEPRLKYSFWTGAMLVRGSVTPRVLLDVILFGLIATIVVLAATISKHRWQVELSVPVGPFEAIGAVLGLLLVLRTNAGYDRWWEARKLWGGIVNQSRAIASEAVAYGPADDQWKSGFVRRVAALPYSIRDHLRGNPASADVARLLGSDFNTVRQASHRPATISIQLATMLNTATASGIHPSAFRSMEQQRGILLDHLGGCERIRKTPLARSSAIQVRRFILLFLISLPFALLNDFHYENFQTTFMGMQFTTSILYVPLFVMLVAYPLLSLDRIGMELQNPFDTRRLDHLPLDALCKTIEDNVAEMLGKDSLSCPDAETTTPSETPRPQFASETYIS
jgi:putative membrane protein